MFSTKTMRERNVSSRKILPNCNIRSVQRQIIKYNEQLLNFISSCKAHAVYFDKCNNFYENSPKGRQRQQPKFMRLNSMCEFDDVNSLQCVDNLLIGFILGTFAFIALLQLTSTFTRSSTFSLCTTCLGVFDGIDL